MLSRLQTSSQQQSTCIFIIMASISHSELTIDRETVLLHCKIGGSKRHRLPIGRRQLQTDATWRKNRVDAAFKKIGSRSLQVIVMTNSSRLIEAKANLTLGYALSFSTGNPSTQFSTSDLHRYLSDPITLEFARLSTFRLRYAWNRGMVRIAILSQAQTRNKILTILTYHCISSDIYIGYIIRITFVTAAGLYEDAALK